ncbi:hypothetical protein ADU90_12530 [Clostridium botulinum]|uniref:Helix-turn-helix domain-containing protein n=1 Tax=Clostridium botulinum C/D str. DC5 TaxID=1443128 RepID=A0A0A0I4K4_CLOBO|nr:helix-turn-helix domain-containing protein [Clostridium botulinum]MCD3241343.1 hypothetical protein [Clostridium botulinum D/C]KGM95578.1 hypothetical protein Z955_14045 [Clostridium botulinum C/D str. DC5]KOC54163.1 hypothetical protein ADU90_12530 [Clostridium botulinum]KOC56507.1 hypothetical protein ADU89_02540 [Clostridium botulinum]MCD3299824.1 hypothetical protein [Clostridium botulinum D/C]
MFINEAYETGKKIKKALQEKNKDVRSAAYKIKEAKNKLDLCHEYLAILMDNDLQLENEFMLDLLKEKTEVKDVQLALCMGLLSENEKFISFAEASKKYGLADGVLRKKRDRGAFKEYEIEKRGREWWISTKALEKIYGEN